MNKRLLTVGISGLALVSGVLLLTGCGKKITYTDVLTRVEGYAVPADKAEPYMKNLCTSDSFFEEQGSEINIHSEKTRKLLCSRDSNKVEKAIANIKIEEEEFSNTQKEINEYLKSNNIETYELSYRWSDIGLSSLSEDDLKIENKDVEEINKEIENIAKKHNLDEVGVKQVLKFRAKEKYYLNLDSFEEKIEKYEKDNKIEDYYSSSCRELNEEEINNYENKIKEELNKIEYLKQSTKEKITKSINYRIKNNIIYCE